MRLWSVRVSRPWRLLVQAEAVFAEDVGAVVFLETRQLVARRDFTVIEHGARQFLPLGLLVLSGNLDELLDAFLCPFILLSVWAANLLIIVRHQGLFVRVQFILR